MANVISCPKCERQLRVPDDLIGQSVKCPSCGETFTAEIANKEPPPVSTSPARPSSRPRDDDDRPSRRPPRRDEVDDDDDERRSRRKRLAPHRGDMVQILGILAFIPFMGLPFILGPIAWILGNTDLAEMDAGRMDPSGRKPTETGRFCGKLAVIIYGSLAIVGFLVWILIVFLYFGAACCCLSTGAGGGAGGMRH